MADDTQDTGRSRPSRGNPLRSAFDDLLDRTNAVTDLVRRTGSGALGATPLPSAVTGLLGSLRQVVEQAPPPTVQLDLFLQEIKAKRALVRALQEQLESFDAQLATLEASLAPLQLWGRQWERVRSTVLGSPGGDAGSDPA